MDLLISCLILFLACGLLTGVFRRFALATKLLDIPNERSSHVLPTPRGGGVVFVLCFLVWLVYAFVTDWVDAQVFYALFVSGLIVAVTGIVDDKYHVSAKRRLLLHFTAIALALFALGGVPQVYFWSWLFPSGVCIAIVGSFFMVWILNLYNFMDGIDGIAAIETVSISLGAVIIYLLHGDAESISLPLALAAVSGGFLCWNFPPARIFMGDAGSGFLGLMIGLLAMDAAMIDPQLFWCWIILLGVFMVDATVTLVRRALQHDSLSEAHCSHAYQHAARRYGQHLPVTLAVLLINFFWLLPVAIIVAYGKIAGLTGVLIAYAPLLILALYFNAGKKD